ncbi:MAG TPA: substrate-binding domain-containing protein, partial [Pirellulaceae bacterium]|nr:substrate-binding domain-containing protein [Pirellulaceae bacterium]
GVGVGGGSATDSSTGSPTSSSLSSSSAGEATGANSTSANSPSARSGERTADASKQAAADSNSNEPLTVYVAASNKAVFEAIRKEYERQYGQTLEVQFGASQTMLAALEVSKSGDLYLPADASFLKVAEQRRLLLSAPYPLAGMKAVLAVAKGNPKGIREWKDLLRDDVKLAQGSDEATAIGKLTRKTLEASGQWETLKARTAVFKTTVNEVANDVKVGAADVGIVFDAVLHDYPTLDAVAIEELNPVTADIGVAVLKSSKSPARAAHFARFLAARDKGLEKYAEFGFKPVEGDPWSERPELTLYSGSMLRPAIEATITEFEQREGVQVTRVYNGCGILVAQMKAGQVPDAYFACDVEFMTQVKEMFPESQGIAQNELVILVKKGNPHKIASLRDLAKEGLRVGIGHEKQCAMGWLTQKTFAEGGIRDEVMKNVVVQTPTGDMLVNQMRSGSLDAAVAYLSNAAGAAGQLDAVRIRGLPCAIATQPYGVAKDSPHKQLAARLRAAIETEESRERFRSEGFNWVGDKAAARD